MNVRGSTGVIQARAFLACHSIDYAETRQYYLAWSEEHGMHYFDLDLPFGDGDAPLHPHVEYVDTAIRIIEECFPGETSARKGKLGRAIFSLIVHRQMAPAKASELIETLRTSSVPPENRGELMLWKAIREA
jgi:hypothetical protein